MTVYIQRARTQTIKYFADDFPAIGILGPRQVGKTTLVKEIAKELNKKSIYFDLEKPSDLEKFNDAELLLNSYKDHCVIIDEIQRRKDLFPLLRSLIDENAVPLRFILLGSASPDLIRDASESLAGRIAYVELLPFNFSEINELKDIQIHQFSGGFPKSILAGSIEKSKRWIDSFIQTYIERDLPLLGLKVSPIQIRRLWEMLAWQNGQLCNYTSISKSLGISNHTLKSYVDFLEEAFLVRRVYPFHYNIKKRLVKAPKIYIRDTGVLHRLLRINDYNQLCGSPFMGGSWENYVIEQITSIKHADIDLFYYRTYNGAEIDLLFVKGLNPIATAEIKFSSAPKVSRGMLSCIEDLKTTKNFIIVPKADRYPVKNNIWVVSLSEFLEKEIGLL